MMFRVRASIQRACVVLSLTAGVFATTGCGRPFEAATPPGFVDLDDRYGDEEYRATTADGLVLGVRAYDNEPYAALDFVVQATEIQMRQLGGYALIDKSPVKARDGLPGLKLTFGHDEGQSPHLYVLALFVDEDYVYLVEAGGEKDQVEAAQKHIDWAIANFLPD